MQIILVRNNNYEVSIKFYTLIPGRSSLQSVFFIWAFLLEFYIFSSKLYNFKA